MSSLLLFVSRGPEGAVRSRRSVLLKHQLLILNCSRRRGPNLRVSDRLIAGLCCVSSKLREAANSSNKCERRNGPLCYKSELMIPFFISFITCLSSFFRSRYNLGLEILALSQQLSIVKRKQPHPRLRMPPRTPDLLPYFPGILRVQVRESRDDRLFGYGQGLGRADTAAQSPSP